MKHHLQKETQLHIGEIHEKCGTNIWYTKRKLCLKCTQDYNSSRADLRQQKYQINKENLKQVYKQYYKDNQEKIKTRSNNYYLRNREMAKSRVSARDRIRKGWAIGEHEKAEAVKLFVTKCASCGSIDPRSKKGFCADHDHKTGMFRDYICVPCNITIGHIEKFGILSGVISYLERFK